MSFILRWTIHPPFPATRATSTRHLGPKSSIMLVNGTYDVFHVKMGLRRPNNGKNGKNVNVHQKCHHYFIVNGVKGCKLLCK